MRLPAVLLLLSTLVAACAPTLPSAVREELARAPKGTVTVVFFTDFQCPHCRRTHAALAPIVEEHEGKVRVVLRHVPLRMHPDARPAARAAICAERLAKPDVAAAYTHALFATQDLSEEALSSLAVEHGLEAAAFRACTADPATDARIDKDRELFVDAGGDGVPLLYVERTRLDGAQKRETLDAAIDEAFRASR